MKPWAIDAREAISKIEDVEKINDSLVHLNSEIEKYIIDDKYYFLVATKGFGKSLLLLYKRKKMKDHILIPESDPLDVPNVGLISKEIISRLYSDKEFEFIWSLSISIAIVKRTCCQCEDASESLKSILSNKNYNSVSSVFGAILSEITRKQFFDDLSNDYRRVLLPSVKNIKQAVSIFIDNIDECFEDYREIWYKAQLNCVRASYNMMRSTNKKINIFVSIRKEAYLKFETEMSLQYNGVSLRISYSKDELLEIFKNNIYEDDKKNLFDESIRNSDPIKSFIGTNGISHGFVDENEDAFSYIYRHTLQRPRDFMLIGLNLSKLSTQDRDPNTDSGLKNLKSCINNSAAEIAKQYLSEVIPHLHVSSDDLEILFKLIPSNILRQEDCKEICREFNGNIQSCNKKNCPSCSAGKHVFCELYKVGLLGYVEPNKIKRDNFIQKFESVGVKTFDSYPLLPSSSYYLIHPVLDELIRERNTSYKHSINMDNIVGKNREWKVVDSSLAGCC